MNALGTRALDGPTPCWNTRTRAVHCTHVCLCPPSIEVQRSVIVIGTENSSKRPPSARGLQWLADPPNVFPKATGCP